MASPGIIQTKCHGTIFVKCITFPRNFANQYLSTQPTLRDTNDVTATSRIWECLFEKNIKAYLQSNFKLLGDAISTGIFLSFPWMTNLCTKQWKGINHTQSTRWQHLSRLKASAFSLQFFLVVMKHSNLYLGLVLPSSGWQSLIACVKAT